MVKAVPSREAIEHWSWVEPLLSKIDVDSGFSLEDILTQIQTAQMQLWVVPEKAACVTTVQVFPQFKTVVVAMLAGDDMDEWFNPLMDTLEEWGRQLGCKYVEEYGREGWIKVGKKRGYEKAFTVMRKEL